MTAADFTYDDNWTIDEWYDVEAVYAPAPRGLPMDVVVLGLAALVALLLVLGLLRLVPASGSPAIDTAVPFAPPNTAVEEVPAVPLAPPAALTGPEVFVIPYAEYWVTQGPHGMSYGHYAIDIAAGKGEAITSPINGTVTALYIDGIGNPTLVVENERYQVTLMHGLYTVQIGDELALGDLLGTESNLGNTRDMAGNSCRNRDCGYHTHLNVYDKQARSNVNPLDLLSSSPPHEPKLNVAGQPAALPLTYNRVQEREKFMNRARTLIVLGVIVLLCTAAGAFAVTQVNQRTDLAAFLPGEDDTDLNLPSGFQAELFASGLEGPRFIAIGPEGDLYAADRGNGRIVRLPDRDGDGRADETSVFAADLDAPHSLTWHEGAWYVGVPSGVIRLRDSDGDGLADERSVLIDDYPTRGHSTRTVEFLRDGRMVVSVGSSCNVCVEEDPRRAAIVVYDGPTADGEAIYASGLRNAVGLAIQPGSGALYASNNGRDLLGDDLPPETIYRVAEGADYGWPFCHNGHLIDPDLGQEGDCDGVPRPLVEMQAHSAPLGIVFYNGQMFPAEYQDDLFIAFHGSWNRSEATGYKIVRLPFENGQAQAAVEDFATGWLEESGTVSGRPVGLAVGGDGALFVSDDKAGKIYRISYRGEN